MIAVLAPSLSQSFVRGEAALFVMTNHSQHG
jgi:hypothetical protein